MDTINNLNDNNIEKNKNLKNNTITYNHDTIIGGNDALKNDYNYFQITLDDIQQSNKNKFIEQVINMVDDIFKKIDKTINSTITNIIYNSYELFITNENENYKDKNNEITITNFFTKISLFISNQSLGMFPEGKINKLLR